MANLISTAYIVAGKNTTVSQFYDKPIVLGLPQNFNLGRTHSSNEQYLLRPPVSRQLTYPLSVIIEVSTPLGVSTPQSVTYSQENILPKETDKGIAQLKSSSYMHSTPTSTGARQDFHSISSVNNMSQLNNQSLAQTNMYSQNQSVPQNVYYMPSQSGQTSQIPLQTQSIPQYIYVVGQTAPIQQQSQQNFALQQSMATTVSQPNDVYQQSPNISQNLGLEVPIQDQKYQEAFGSQANRRVLNETFVISQANIPHAEPLNIQVNIFAHK